MAGASQTLAPFPARGHERFANGRLSSAWATELGARVDASQLQSARWRKFDRAIAAAKLTIFGGTEASWVPMSRYATLLFGVRE